MRIIAGKLKGHKLKSFDAKHIRPTTDRVKESLFNILQAYLENANVLDLFAGTGNLSIEAYSRGAKSVVSVEKHPLSLKIIFENLKLLKIERDVQVVKADVFQFLKKNQFENFDVIFIDPPFTEALADEVMENLSQTKLYHASTVIAIESAKKEKLLSKYGNLSAVDARHYGDKVLTFFKVVTTEDPLNKPENSIQD